MKKFVEQTIDEKILTIFNWFVCVGAIKKFVNDKAKISLSDIKVKKLPCWLYNTEVINNLDILKPYMESDAFQFVFLQVHPNNGEKDNVLWICHFCKRNLNISQRLDNKSSRAILCECCLRWYHCECISFEEPIDETITYFCNLCKKK